MIFSISNLKKFLNQMINMCLKAYINWIIYIYIYNVTHIIEDQM